MAEEDLIFGKNRHFFGGIEPSTMQTFGAIRDTTVNKIKIEVVLPANTIIDGQTLCTVAGTVIRRSTADYPKDEFDGDLVADVTSNTSFYDESADEKSTYYYAAFPYTTQGVYSRNATNRVYYEYSAVVTDVDAMPVFTAKSVYDATNKVAAVQLTYEFPEKAIGVVIRKSATAYPETESDGEEVTTVTSNGTFTDTNVVIGTTYYYSAFPYTESGYSRRTENRAACVPSKYEYFYGFDISLSDSNPETRVSYPSDVDNASFEPAKMGTDEFGYGGWSIAAGQKFMPRPCMLTYAGTVDHYLDPNDYTKKEDGSASQVANTSFDGNAMMEWGKIYTKRWTENDVYHFRCSDVKIDDDYECWCNYDRQNQEIPHFYTPIYFGSNVSDKLRSISGQTNSVSTTAETEITLAKANGNDWYTEVLADRLLIQDLLVMMAKSTDCQTAFGMGTVSASAAIAQGTMNTKGLFWGSTDKTSGVKVFGMENLWGNLWRRTAGYILDNGTQKVKITRGTKDGSTATDYNLDGTGYKTIADLAFTGSSGGYISEMKTETFGRLPSGLAGSSSTYEADATWYNNSDIRYASVGGNWYGGLVCGPFAVHLHAATSTSSTGVGAALSCKPLA